MRWRKAILRSRVSQSAGVSLANEISSASSNSSWSFSATPNQPASRAHIHELVTLTRREWDLNLRLFTTVVGKRSGLSIRRRGQTSEPGINVIRSEWRISIYGRRMRPRWRRVRREGVHILIFETHPTMKKIFFVVKWCLPISYLTRVPSAVPPPRS